MSSHYNLLSEEGVKFNKIKESDVSREMSTRYLNDLIELAECDVVIVGGGPSGLTCAYELSKHPNLKVALIEASVAPGGGGWVGGQLFSAMVVRKPAHHLLAELDIPFDEKEDYVVVKHAALFTSTIISKVIKNGVKLYNATAVEDLIIRDGVVGGVVTNWSLVTKAHGTQSCMDPQVIESKIVVSSCGHDGPFGATGVRRLAELELIPKIPGMKALDMNASEDAIVKNTQELVPGLIITGMEVAEAIGTPRMGPTFGAMLLSGQKAALLALQKLKTTNGQNIVSK